MRPKIKVTCVFALLMTTLVSPVLAFESPVLECPHVDDGAPHDGSNQPALVYCQVIEEDAPFPTGDLSPESTSTEIYGWVFGVLTAIGFPIAMTL